MIVFKRMSTCNCVTFFVQIEIGCSKMWRFEHRPRTWHGFYLFSPLPSGWATTTVLTFFLTNGNKKEAYEYFHTLNILSELNVK